MRLDTDGLEGWTRLFGGDGEDQAHAVSVRRAEWSSRARPRACGTRSPTRTGSSRGSTSAVGSAWSFSDRPEDDTDAFSSIVPRADGVYFAGWTSGTFLQELAAGGPTR